jgi:hypothetical protein
MSVLETLAQLRAGQRPASGLLHTCRLHAFGSEVYGTEAIVERFRMMPFVVPVEQIVVTAPGHLALFAGAGAMIADVIGDNIARLWRVGPGVTILPEPGVSVVFNPDLEQARGDVFFSASDHLSLADDAAQRVEAIGRDLARADDSFRARAFAIRAFGTADEGAALFAVYQLSGDAVRTSGFVHVAMRWSGDTVTIVRDAAGAAAVAATPWTPRIGA